MMMINRRRVYGGKSLPYDYEVEYIESQINGSNPTMYINTGYFGTENSAFELKFVYLGKGQSIFGSRSTDTNAIIISKVNTRFGSADIRQGLSNNTLYVATLDKRAYTLNGVSYKVSTSSFTTGTSLQLFGAHDRNVIPGLCKIYYFRMWENGVLMCDYIPVVKDGVGYMYDKVSGQLFGNSGTGSFIVGPRVS